MAFIYAPDGTKLLTGDLDSIRRATNDWPTCLGWIVPYRNGQQTFPGRPHMFGKMADYRKTAYVSVNRESRCMDPRRRDSSLRKRRLWVISLNRGIGDEEEIMKVRNLPKRYLGVFKTIDQNESP